MEATVSVLKLGKSFHSKLGSVFWSQKNKTEENIWRLIGIGCAAIQFIVLLALSLEIWRRDALTWDFSIFAQAWTLIGRGILNPFDSVMGILYIRNHFELIMWLAALFYPIFHSAFTLLVIQDFFAAASSLAAFIWILKMVYWRVNSVVVSRLLLGLSLCILLLNPWVYWVNGFDFHWQTTATFFAIITAFHLYHREEGHPKIALISALLTWTTGDVCVTYIVGIALLGLLIPKAHRKMSLFLLVSSLVYFLLISHFHLNTSGIVGGILSSFPGKARNTSVIELLIMLLTHPGIVAEKIGHKWVDIYSNIMPSGLVGVLSPYALGLSLPVIIENNLAQGQVFAAPTFNSYPLYPFVAVGSIHLIVSGWRWIAKRRPYAANLMTYLFVAFAALNALGWFLVWMPAYSSHWITVTRQQGQELSRLSHNISPKDEVVASQGIMGRFAEREYAYGIDGPGDFPINAENTVVLIAPYNGTETASPQQSLAMIDYLLRCPRARLLGVYDNIWEFKVDDNGRGHILRLPGSVPMVPAGELKSAVGKRAWLKGVPVYESEGDAMGYVTYGNYYRLDKGRYAANVRLNSEGTVKIEVWNATDGKCIARRTVTGRIIGDMINLPFVIQSEVKPEVFDGFSIFQTRMIETQVYDNFEVRVWAANGTKVTVFSEGVQRVQ